MQINVDVFLNTEQQAMRQRRCFRVRRLAIKEGGRYFRWLVELGAHFLINGG